MIYVCIKEHLLYNQQKEIRYNVDKTKLINIKLGCIKVAKITSHFADSLHVEERPVI